MTGRKLRVRLLSRLPRLAVVGGRGCQHHKGPSASCRRRTTSDGRAAIRLIAGNVVTPRRRNRTGSVPSGDCPEGMMFEPLGDTEKKTSGRTMRIIWIVIAVVAVILTVISFA